MSKTNQIFRLKDGRTLGFAEYGCLTGFPVIGLHGTPGSRLWFAEDDATSTELNLRLITVDRPGYGNSDVQPGRSIIDFNNDLKELITYLKLEKFSIFGVSGGGAYAASFASSHINRLHKAGLIASVYKYNFKSPPKLMSKENKMGFRLARYAPLILRYSFRQQKHLISSRPSVFKKYYRKSSKSLAISDRELLSSDEFMNSIMIQFKEGFKQNCCEAVNELKLFSKDFGFNYEAIQCPVEIWHGVDDTLSPIQGIYEVSKKIQNCHTNYIINKGHFLDDDKLIWERILRSLIE